MLSLIAMATTVWLHVHSGLKIPTWILFSIYFFPSPSDGWFYKPHAILVGGWPTPLKNMSSSVGMIIPNKWKNHQPVYIYNIIIYIYSQYCWFTLFITGKSSIVPNHQPVLLLPQSVDPLPTRYQRPHQPDVFSSPRRPESSAVAPSCGNCDVHERRGREQIEMPLNGDLYTDWCRICMGSIGDLYGESFVCWFIEWFIWDFNRI